MPNDEPTTDRTASGVPRGAYSATPDTNPEQARQELADLERSGPPSDPVFAAERAALRRAAGGGKP